MTYSLVFNVEGVRETPPFVRERLQVSWTQTRLTTSLSIINKNFFTMDKSISSSKIYELLSNKTFIQNMRV